MKTLKLIIAIVLAVLLGLLLGFRLNAWWQESETVQALMPTNGRLIETSEGRLHISQWGDPQGPAVLMTHGMAAWGGLWQETAVSLAEAGYHVIAVDQPPFGFSDRQEMDFSRTAQAARLKALTDALGLKGYFLVGHSYGGGVALEAAILDKEKLKGLVLVCPFIGLAPGEAVPPAGDVPLLLASDFVAETLVALTITNPLLTGYLTQQFMHRKTALTEMHVDTLQRPMRLKGNTSFMVIWLRQFLAGDPNAKSRQRDVLREFDKPVAMLWGEKDTVTPIEQGIELRGLMNPTKFTTMPDVGHMPQLEIPEEFSGLLIEAFEALGGLSGVNPEG